jgi:hypothetical protein
MTQLPRPARRNGPKALALPRGSIRTGGTPCRLAANQALEYERTKAIWPPLKTGADFCMVEL